MRPISVVKVRRVVHRMPLVRVRVYPLSTLHLITNCNMSRFRLRNVRRLVLPSNLRPVYLRQGVLVVLFCLVRGLLLLFVNRNEHLTHRYVRRCHDFRLVIIMVKGLRRRHNGTRTVRIGTTTRLRRFHPVTVHRGDEGVIALGLRL